MLKALFTKTTHSLRALRSKSQAFFSRYKQTEVRRKFEGALINSANLRQIILQNGNIRGHFATTRKIQWPKCNLGPKLWRCWATRLISWKAFEMSMYSNQFNKLFWKEKNIHPKQTTQCCTFACCNILKIDSWSWTREAAGDTLRTLPVILGATSMSLEKRRPFSFDWGQSQHTMGIEIRRLLS